ncbi:MAG: serine hydrolase domain-containing protein [Acidimicrobiales bacterium]
MRALDVVATWPVGSAAAGILGTFPAPGAAAVREGVWAQGTVGDPARTYDWASVTKLCTALAVLVAVEEGTIALDEPAGPPGATVAHLLAHASGLAPDRREAVAAPGTKRVYSNAGYELLADLVAARAEVPFTRYLAEAVFEPLGMRTACLAEGASAAWGMVGTLVDALALGAELLRPRIVAPQTLARARTVAFPGLAGVLPGYGHQDPCDWGLGAEIRDGKRPHWTGARCSPQTFGHFGRAGGFLWLDPVAGLGCAALTDRPFGPWAAQRWPELADGVIDELASARGGVPGG